MASEVKRALESTESLIASLRNVTTPTDTIDHDQLGPHKHPPPLDVEQSLLGTGEGLILPITSTHQAVPTPLNIESSPVNTLSSLVNRSLINGIDGSVDPVYLQEQLYQAEKDLHLSAKVGLALAERVDFLEKEVNRLTIHSGSVERSLKQCQHELVRKDSLLKLYYKQELEEGEEQPRPPQWVETLKEENVQLKSAMESLTEDNAKLQHNLEMALAKEKTLVKECYGQLSTCTNECLMDDEDIIIFYRNNPCVNIYKVVLVNSKTVGTTNYLFHFYSFFSQREAHNISLCISLVSLNLLFGRFSRL
jgi:hypothetical protein